MEGLFGTLYWSYDSAVKNNFLIEMGKVRGSVWLAQNSGRIKEAGGL